MAGNTWEVVGIQRVDLAYKGLDDLAANVNTTVTTMTVGVGQGVTYAAASVTAPIRTYIDTELIYVTGRSTDTLTIVRAQEGTTAANHTSGTGNLARESKVQFTLANAFALNAQNQELIFEGDQARQYVTLNLGMKGSMQADLLNDSIMESIMGIVPVTANIPTASSKRWYFEAGTYPGLSAYVKVKAIQNTGGTAGTTVYFRLYVPALQIYPRPWWPGNLGTAAKQPMALEWTAQQTLTDILGFPLPGAPSTGVMAVLDLLA